MGSPAAVIEAKRAERADNEGPVSSASAQPLDRDARRREDDVLVERARRGEMEAFEALYKRHSSAIFGL